MKIRISIRRKILLTFAIFFLVSLLLTFYGYYKYHVLNQKISLIENKEILLNSILEARRYEKNFFITRKIHHLEKALEYAQKSKSNLIRLIRRFDAKALPGGIEQQLVLLRKYETSLEFLLKDEHWENFDSGDFFAGQTDGGREKATIPGLGRELTIAVESALQQERSQVKHLIFHSRQYLFVFLGLILLIACVTFVFLIHNGDTPFKTQEESSNRIIARDQRVAFRGDIF